MHQGTNEEDYSSPVDVLKYGVSVVDKDLLEHKGADAKGHKANHHLYYLVSHGKLCCTSLHFGGVFIFNEQTISSGGLLHVLLSDLLIGLLVKQDVHILQLQRAALALRPAVVATLLRQVTPVRFA